MGKLSGLKEGLEKAAKALDMSQAAKLVDPVAYTSTAGGKANSAAKNTIASSAEIVNGANVDEFLVDELLENGAKISPDGMVTVYHRTSTKAANDIKKTGKMTGKEDRIFFSTSREGQNAGYGEDVVEMQIPINKLQLDDVFGDEAHLSLNIGKPGSLVDVSKYISNYQYAPLAIGAGAAGLALSPQESQAAVSQQLASQPVSNEVADIWQRNLNPVGLNERGVPVTGQMRATPHPLLMQVADKLRMVDTPIGQVFGGAADYLDKLGAGEEVNYWDRLGAALDVIP